MTTRRERLAVMARILTARAEPGSDLAYWLHFLLDYEGFTTPHLAPDAETAAALAAATALLGALGWAVESWWGASGPDDDVWPEEVGRPYLAAYAERMETAHAAH